MIVPEEVRKRRRTVIDAAIIFLIIILIVQMWLLSATLESYLAGHHDAALPGMAVSAILFLSCVAIYRFVMRLER
jgi:hypothetical protein